MASQHQRPHPIKQLKRFLVGQPLRSNELEHQRLSKTTALAVLSSDALSSVAYATEEILWVLAGASAVALNFTLPVGIAIAVLLTVVVFSYRQTIFAYPGGGGAYIVARENLGTAPGLVAGASLLLDYVLTVAVSIASGVDALTSLYPSLHQHQVLIALFMIALITVANLRGVRESGAVFQVPTYLFVVLVLFMVVTGLVRLWAGAPVLPAPTDPSLVQAGFSLSHFAGFGLAFLVARAFASGCSALTGVEAISNGVSIFRVPEAKNAANTLLAMGGLLLTMFLGITYLAHSIHIVPKETETVLSQLGRWAFNGIPGGPGLHWALNIGTMLILVLAANTSFADFPRLASLMAKDGFLPRQFANRGDRLVFTNGIVILGVLAALLIVLFRADTHRLIPLYAIGVFTSFTLSQSGMVVHHLRGKERGRYGHALINGIGALLTAIVFVVQIATKFTEGAWMIVILVPLLCASFLAIRRHYNEVADKLRITKTPELKTVHQRVIVPLSGVSKMVINTLQYARSLSDDVTAVYVATDPDQVHKMQEKWDAMGLPIPLEFLPSPYRSLTEPLMRYLDKVERQHPDDLLAVVLPEFVPSRFWQHLLHNQSALLLKGALLFRKHTAVVSVPYHLGDEA